MKLMIKKTEKVKKFYLYIEQNVDVCSESTFFNVIRKSLERLKTICV